MTNTPSFRNLELKPTPTRAKRNVQPCPNPSHLTLGLGMSSSIAAGWWQDTAFLAALPRVFHHMTAPRELQGLALLLTGTLGDFGAG